MLSSPVNVEWLHVVTLCHAYSKKRSFVHSGSNFHLHHLDHAYIHHLNQEYKFLYIWSSLSKSSNSRIIALRLSQSLIKLIFFSIYFCLQTHTVTEPQLAFPHWTLSRNDTICCYSVSFIQHLSPQSLNKNNFLIFLFTLLSLCPYPFVTMFAVAMLHNFGSQIRPINLNFFQQLWVTY